MISKANTVEEFLDTLGEDERAVFGKVRAMLRRASRKIEESMQYRMPTYTLEGEPFGAFNKQKNYLCVYLKPKAIDPHRPELKKRGLDCGKSCLRFKRPSDLPLDLVEKIVKSAVKLKA